MSILSGVFKRKYGAALEGKDWVRRIEPEDQAVFIQVGIEAWEYGHKGGIARASTAERDERGRFAPKGGKQ